MVSKGQIVGIDWNRIVRLHNLSLIVVQWLEHPTRSRRVTGLHPIWDSDFFSSLCFDNEINVQCSSLEKINILRNLSTYK